jgi:hypothetical protein
MHYKYTLSLFIFASLTGCGGFGHKLDESQLAGEKVAEAQHLKSSPEATASIKAASSYMQEWTDGELSPSNWEDITRNEGLQIWKKAGKAVRIQQESEPVNGRSQLYDAWIKNGKLIALFHVAKTGRTAHTEAAKTWCFSADGKCYDASTSLESDAVAAIISSPFPNYILALRTQELDVFKKEMGSLKSGSNLGAKAYTKPGQNATWLVWNTQTEDGPRTVYAHSEAGKIDFWKVESPKGEKYALTVFQHVFFGEWQQPENIKSKIFYLDLAENMGQVEFLQAHGLPIPKVEQPN